MQRGLIRLCCSLLLLVAAAVHGETDWVEGKHYFLIQPAQPKILSPTKIEVVEAFSYGCTACNRFYPAADKLKAALPANAQLIYLPASFIPAENWPMFQRAFYAAQALGLVERTHDAMFKAIWESDELAIVDRKTNRLKKPLPSIEDAAKFYNRVTGVKIGDYLAAAKSFGVEANIKRAEALLLAYKVGETPTLIVNGKYRLTPITAGSDDKAIELVKWLVAKESK